MVYSVCGDCEYTKGMGQEAEVECSALRQNSKQASD